MSRTKHAPSYTMKTAYERAKGEKLAMTIPCEEEEDKVKTPIENK